MNCACCSCRELRRNGRLEDAAIRGLDEAGLSVDATALGHAVSTRSDGAIRVAIVRAQRELQHRAKCGLFGCKASQEKATAANEALNRLIGALEPDPPTQRRPT